MQDTDELVIEITPDAEVAPEIEKPVKAAEIPDKPAKVDTPEIEPVEDLRKQLETMRATGDADKAARRAAEEQARQATEAAARALEEAAAAKTQVADTEITAIEAGIEAAKTEADAAEAEYKAAFDAGDGARMATAQRKMARAEAKIASLDEGRAAVEARKASEPKPGAVRAPAPAAPADPLERALTAVQSPRTRDWLRAHPEFVMDQKQNRRANAAHNMAVAEGHAPDSDGYFDYCEKFLGLKDAEPEARPEPKKNGAAEKPTTRTKPMPGAPVSREAVSMNGSLTPTQVVLTRGEQAAAQDGSIVWNYTDPKIGAVKGEPIGVKEYARRKLTMQKQGAYDRSFTEQ